MNERLTPSLASPIGETVERGLPTNAGAAVREALRLLREPDQLQFPRLRAALAEAENARESPSHPNSWSR